MTITIQTDEQTVEQVKARRFLLNGAPFDGAWSRIETGEGHTRDGLRVIAWVCEQGETVIDWRL